MGHLRCKRAPWRHPKARLTLFLPRASTNWRPSIYTLSTYKTIPTEWAWGDIRARKFLKRCRWSIQSLGLLNQIAIVLRLGLHDRGMEKKRCTFRLMSNRYRRKCILYSYSNNESTTRKRFLGRLSIGFRFSVTVAFAGFHQRPIDLTCVDVVCVHNFMSWCGD